MKFCVYGAGAIGGYLAVELALSGHEVCVVARGPHLEAICERGRSLEIDVLVTVVMELGLWTHVPTPVVNAVLALVQARGRAAGLYTPVGTSR